MRHIKTAIFLILFLLSFATFSQGIDKNKLFEHAIHPISGNVFILASVGNLLVTFLIGSAQKIYFAPGNENIDRRKIV